MSIPYSGVNYIDSLMTGYSWGGAVGTARTVSYAFGTDFGYVPSASDKTAFQAAMQEWSNVANITFTQGSYNANIFFSDIYLYHGNIGVSGVAGVTAFPNGYSGNGLNDVAVIIDDNLSSFSKGSVGYMTMMHEIGHALGLDHPGNYGQGSQGPFLPPGQDSTNATVMSYYQSPGVPSSLYGAAASSPMIYDIAAIQYLYGANTSYHNGTDTYSFSGTTLRTTIWDGGGSDTISAASYTGGYGGARVDLREGLDTYSQIGASSVWNAFGTNIEHAIGSNYSDTIIGNSLANSLTGAGGDDTIIGGAGNDSMDGGQGNDLFYVDVAGDVVTEASGQGTDMVISTVSYTLDSEVENLQLSGSNLAGTGNASNNILSGTAGANYQLDGQGGDDILTGGAGNDTLIGGAGVDVLNGGAGNDVYYTDGLDQILDTGGYDTVYSTGSFTMVTWVEAFSLTGSGAADVTGTTVANSITGNAGVNQLYGLGGNDTIDGGGDNDLIYGDEAPGAKAIRGADILTGGAGNDTINGGLGIDQLYGGTGADLLYADRSGGLGRDADQLFGQDGNDTLNGGNGADRLYGGNDADLLYGDQAGGRGKDLIYGEAGDDTLNGFLGIDQLFGGSGNDVIYGDQAGGAGRDADLLFGEDGNDSLYGSAGANKIYGGAGDDSIVGDANGGTGRDMIYGDDGNDTLYGFGGADKIYGGTGNDYVEADAGGQSNADYVYAGDGNDTIIGGGGTDRLFGEGGNDLIYGDLNGGIDRTDYIMAGAGNDTIYGGGGKDYFQFTIGSQGDEIMDFEGAGVSGGDVIQIMGYGIRNIATLAPYISYAGTDATINFGNGDIILVHGVNSPFIASDFKFS